MSDTYCTDMPDPVKVEKMMQQRTLRMEDSIVRINAMDTEAKVEVTVKGTGLAARVLYNDGYLIREHKKREEIQFDLLKKEYAILANKRRRCMDRLTGIEVRMLKIDTDLGIEHS